MAAFSVASVPIVSRSAYLQAGDRRACSSISMIRWLSSGRRPFSASTTGRSASTAAGSKRALSTSSRRARRGWCRARPGRRGADRAGRRSGSSSVEALVSLPKLAPSCCQISPRLAGRRKLSVPRNSHMLDEMRPAAFADPPRGARRRRSGADRDLAGRKRVAADRVAQAVGQGAERPCRVAGDVAAASRASRIARWRMERARRRGGEGRRGRGIRS